MAFRAALAKLYREWPGDASLGRFGAGRFLYINAWRNIADTTPITDNHLACCDETSLVTPDDYVPVNNPQGKPRYALSPRRYEQHRWYCFPRMRQSEILLFKLWDSDPTRPTRMCFHTAFMDPMARKEAPPRESIEVRAIAFSPNHQPNTCPSVPWVGISSVALEPVSSAVAAIPVARRIVLAMAHVTKWPLPAQRLVATAPATRPGASIVLEAILRDPRNRLGLQMASQETKRAVRAEILASDDFYNAFLQAKQRIASSEAMNVAPLTMMARWWRR